MDQVLCKLVNVLTEPVQLLMLFWICTLLWSNRKLLAAQEERGVMMAKMTVMIEMLLKGGKK
jgi:hypothetical protein